MGNRTPPWPEYDAWTTARYWQFIRSALRKAWMKWPPKFQVMKEHRRDVKNKRHRFEYKCQKCKGWFVQKEVAVDHVEPAGALNKYEDLVPFMQRLFVGVDKLQLLCRNCHAIKTKEERDGNV